MVALPYSVTSLAGAQARTAHARERVEIKCLGAHMLRSQRAARRLQGSRSSPELPVSYMHAAGAGSDASPILRGIAIYRGRATKATPSPRQSPRQPPDRARQRAAPPAQPSAETDSPPSGWDQPGQVDDGGSLELSGPAVHNSDHSEVTVPSDPVLTRERAAIESLERELAALRGMLEQTRQERAGERHAYEEREAQLKKEAEEGFMELYHEMTANSKAAVAQLQAELHAAKEEGGARERRALERAAAAEAALREAEQQHQDELQRVREAAAHEAESGLAQRLQQAFEEGRQAEAKAGRHRLAERQRKLVLESQRQLATAVAVQEERVRGLQQQLAAAQEELSRRAQLTSTRDAGGHSTQLDAFRAEAGGAVAREEALAQEQQRLAALEVELQSRFEAHCQQFELRLRLRAAQLLREVLLSAETGHDPAAVLASLALPSGSASKLSALPQLAVLPMLSALPCLPAVAEAMGASLRSGLSGTSAASSAFPATSLCALPPAFYSPVSVAALGYSPPREGGGAMSEFRSIFQRVKQRRGAGGVGGGSAAVPDMPPLEDMTATSAPVPLSAAMATSSAAQAHEFEPIGPGREEGGLPSAAQELEQDLLPPVELGGGRVSPQPGGASMLTGRRRGE